VCGLNAAPIEVVARVDKKLGISRLRCDFHLARYAVHIDLVMLSHIGTAPVTQREEAVLAKGHGA
jgi:hypothetical protein